jgi:hypothetical protein
VFSGVFTVAEMDGADDKERGDTTTVDIQTLFVAFSHTSLKSACLNDGFFFWQKTELPVLGLLSSSAQLSGFLNYQMSD